MTRTNVNATTTTVVTTTAGPSKAATKSNGHRKPNKVDAEMVQFKKSKASSSSSGSDASQPKEHRPTKPAKDGAKQRQRQRQEKRAVSAEASIPVPVMSGKSKPKAVATTATTTAPATPRKQRRQSPASTPSKPQPKTTVSPPSRHSSPVHASTGPLPSQPKRRTSPSPTAPASPPSRPTRDHAYAGPTFSNSPAASRLPMPDFLLGTTAVSSGVPSLSPSSSTTSLHQYHSTPPSPTRTSPGVDLTTYTYSSEPETTSHHDSSYLHSTTPANTNEALRSRSLELLGLLRGNQAQVEEASRSGPVYSSYASYPAPAPAVAHSDPFLVDRRVPMPATRLYDALGAYDASATKPMMATPHWPHAAPMPYAMPNPYTSASYPPASMMPPTMTPMLQHAATKSINDMYSDKLRALLRLDVQA